MAPKESSDAFKLLYLDQEEPRRPQFSSSAVRNTSPDSFLNPSSQSSHPKPTPKPVQRPVNRSPSVASSHSSVPSQTDSNRSSSRQNSLLTRASSISVPNWQAPPTFVQHMAMQPFVWGYDLPCEFFFLGCNLRFDPGNVEEWISHSVSHFVNAPLPSTTICTFCDEATFRSDGDEVKSWRERMLHIFDHLAALTPSEYMRPDFWVIEHMKGYGLLSSEDHAHAVQGTERPYCDNMYPLDWKPQDMLAREDKDSQETYEIGREDRQRRKDTKKGKSTSTPSNLHRSKKSYNPRVEKRPRVEDGGEGGLRG